MKIRLHGTLYEIGMLRRRKRKSQNKQVYSICSVPKLKSPGVVKFDLTEEPRLQEAIEDEAEAFTFKVAEPITDFVPAAEEQQPEPEPIIGADDNKTQESMEEQLRQSRERIMRLKDLSMKLRSGNIQEMENVPAYKRKEIALQEPPASDESQVSRFSLLPDNEGKVEIRNNNSFLHDNVD